VDTSGRVGSASIRAGLLADPRIPTSPEYELRDDVGAARYDVFGTANFLNFMTWTASIEYLLDKGIAAVRAYDETLVEQLIAGLTGSGYRLISPMGGSERSTLVVFTHEDRSRNAQIQKRLEEEGVHIAERDQKLRISPHLYNTPQDVKKATSLLSELA
jgi:cysteine desulfurase / selenocysteine lyase